MIASVQQLTMQAVPIWLSGGWGMVALAIDGMVISVLGCSIFLDLLQKGVVADPDVAWRKWRQDAARATGPLSRIISGAMACRSVDRMLEYFELLRKEEFASFSRDLKVMHVAVTVAPLLGLLGTVTGMLTTFKALSSGGGGDQTMGMIAGGISEALITTETGLVLGLSGMIYQFALKRQHEKLEKKITHLEITCAKNMNDRFGEEALAA